MFGVECEGVCGQGAGRGGGQDAIARRERERERENSYKSIGIRINGVPALLKFS